MEPLTHYFDHINRTGIGIIPKEPFKAWLFGVFPDTDDSYFDDNNLYLVNSELTGKEADVWLEEHYGDIFENELNGWTEDQTNWPAERTFTLFNEWFTITYFGLIHDLEEEVLRRE